MLFVSPLYPVFADIAHCSYMNALRVKVWSEPQFSYSVQNQTYVSKT